MLDFQELFLLAQSSESGCNSVRQITATLSPPIEIHYSSYDHTLSLTRRKAENNPPVPLVEIRFFQKSSDQVQQLGEDQFKAYPLEGSTKLNVAFLNPLHVVCAVEEGHSLVWMALECIDYLKRVFSAKFDKLHFPDANKDFLMILAARDPPTGSLSMGKDTVSHQDMRKLLGVSWKELRLDCTPEAGFVYEKPISVDRLRFKDAQWFNGQNLLDIDASRIRIGRCTLKSEDLNLFIHQWLQGEHEKLEHLAIYGALGIVERKIQFPFDLDMEKVLEGVKTFPGIGANGHELNFRLNSVIRISSFDKGLDIRRESDGMRATILYAKSRFDQNYFVFAVWNTPMMDETKSKALKLNDDRPKNSTPEALETACKNWKDSMASIMAEFKDGVRASEEIRKKAGEVSRERMRSILESATGVLDSVYHPTEGFVYEKPLSIHTLKLENANWLNTENLLELDSARIHLGSSTLTSKDLNLFIHQWLNGSSTKLEYLCIVEAKENVDLTLVTDGMLTMPGSSKVGLKTSMKDRKINFEDGLDVQRASDGLIATVVLTREYRFAGEKFFAFVVWHPEGSSQNADVEEVVKEESRKRLMEDFEDLIGSKVLKDMKDCNLDSNVSEDLSATSGSKANLFKHLGF